MRKGGLVPRTGTTAHILNESSLRVTTSGRRCKGGLAAQCLTNCARLPLERIVALLTAVECAAGLLELVQCDSCEWRRRMIMSCVVMDLSHRHNDMVNVRFIRPLVDDRLRRSQHHLNDLSTKVTGKTRPEFSRGHDDGCASPRWLAAPWLCSLR